jgi:hypothetical protein
MRYLATAALAAMALSCGPSANTGDLPPCNLTLSGAVTSAQQCRSVVATWAQVSNQTAVLMNPVGTPIPTVTVAIGFTGQLRAGTFTHADAGAVGQVVVTSGASQWAAFPVSFATPQGTYSLIVTDPGVSTASGNGTIWPAVVGTLDATLPAIAGTSASGSVTLHLVF